MKKLIGLGLTGLVVTVASVNAATTSYTDEAAFLAGLGSAGLVYDLNTFDDMNFYGFAQNTMPVMGTYGGSVASYTVSSMPVFAINGAASVTSAGDALVVDLLSQVYGIGGTIYASDEITGLPIAGDITATLSDGSLITLNSIGFAGFISDMAITKLTLSSPGFASLDNLYVANVPEPSVIAMNALVLLGAAGGFVAYRRRKA